MDHQHVERYKMIIDFSKTDDAPKYLKKLVTSITTSRQVWKDASIEFTQFRKKTFENKKEYILDVIEKYN